MSQLCDIQIHVNGHQTFFLNEQTITKYSERLKKIIKQESRRVIEIKGFPGGPTGFELVSRFCYNNGRIKITVSNVSLLHCCSIFLGMTDTVSSTNNLLQQTELFLEGMFYWSWSDIIASLKSCESIFKYAYSCGLVEKFICALLAKIAQHSDLSLIIASPSTPSSSSSPETSYGCRFSCTSTKTTPESIIKPSCSSSPSPSKAWWFDDLTTLSPAIIEKIIKGLGAYGAENNSLILTRFLLHYLKGCVQAQGKGGGYGGNGSYSGLADTAVHGVIFIGKCSFSCRKLFWVLRIVSNFGISKDCRAGLEKMIGGMLDEATLDDLLVSGQGYGNGHDRGVYDVNLVIRLIRIFVNSNSSNNDLVGSQKLKKFGRLIDKYLGEISPDQKLKVPKFLGVAESLPDSARECFDGVYRAVDIYLESHPTLSFKERSELCRCLNYKKLTLEASKYLAKNPKIPPNVAIQALMSQHSKLPTKDHEFPYQQSDPKRKIDPSTKNSQVVLHNGAGAGVIDDAERFSGENENVRLNLQTMQRRVRELEEVCREMKGHMHKLVRHDRNLPRLC
ncbi:hypothetical protein AB3S75_035352 [Citrus x aurantiifolia]